MAKMDPNVVEFDEIEKPVGYNQGEIEVLIFIDDQKLDFCEGNVVKYICRHKFKNGIKDLKKARTYLDRLIGFTERRLKKQEQELARKEYGEKGGRYA